MSESWRFSWRSAWGAELPEVDTTRTSAKTEIAATAMPPTWFQKRGEAVQRPRVVKVHGAELHGQVEA